MKAILEIEMPESCKACDLERYNYNDDRFCLTLWCTVSDYDNTRHPDCPLKIAEQRIANERGLFDE